MQFVEKMRGGVLPGSSSGWDGEGLYSVVCHVMSCVWRAGSAKSVESAEPAKSAKVAK